MKHIYFYENYRVFLKDYFSERKKTRDSFSHRYFAQKCGFSSSSYIHKVITGSRNLSQEAIQKIASAMGLKQQGAEYFKLLVMYDQAKKFEEKEPLLAKINTIRKASNVFTLDKTHLKYYDTWYYPVVRELVCFTKWNSDYKKLASMVFPEISEKQAKDSVEELENMGMIKKNSEGEYYPTNKILSSEDIPAFVKKNARRDVMKLGIEAADSLPSDQRHVAYSTFTIDKKTFEKVTEMLDEVRKTIVFSSAEIQNPDDVYHLIMEVFPSSKVNSRDKKKFLGGEQ